jgi:putative hydrolase of HD superfamily
MTDQRLLEQIRFIAEVDRLKTVLRQSRLTDGSRQENSAEHSWHLGLMAMLLHEFAEAGTDVRRVMEMVLVHDIVEIDAGDTFAYDAEGNADRAAREAAAADRLFALLPADQCMHVRELWNEFERGDTPEARYALALDRMQPLIQNVMAGGGSWLVRRVTREQVLDRMMPIQDLSAPLWAWVVSAIDETWRLMDRTEDSD